MDLDKVLKGPRVTPEQPEHNGKTTALSTIGVQSGKTRIVIALLVSKEWLELKICEMEPSLIDIGRSLTESLDYQAQHQQALKKLENKQTPVEKLLSQADEIISSQKAEPIVFSAMAENLSLAWKNINVFLQKRQRILDQAVAFYRRCDQFAEKIEKAESSFSDVELPENLEKIKKIVSDICDLKKALLEASMFAMNEQQLLLSLLNELAEKNMLDSRPLYQRNEIKAMIYHVVCYLERLQEKRRKLQILFTQRKTSLDQQYLRLKFMKQLIEMSTRIAEEKSILDGILPGSNAREASIARYKMDEIERNLKSLGVDAIKMARDIDQHREEMNMQVKEMAYSTLEDYSGLMFSLEEFREIQSRFASFLEQAQLVSCKLDTMMESLTATGGSTPQSSQQQPSSSPQSSSLTVSHIQETIQEVLDQGYKLLEDVGSNQLYIKPINVKLQEIQDKAQDLQNQLGRIPESSSSSKAATAAVSTSTDSESESDKFNKKFSQLCDDLTRWLVENVSNFLKGHQDMGSALIIVRDFLDKHKKIAIQLETRSIEVKALLSVINKMDCEGQSVSDQVRNKMDQLCSDWEYYSDLLDRRILLSQRYTTFQKVFTDVTKNLDSLENDLVSLSEVKEEAMKKFREEMVSLKQEIVKLNNLGSNFVREMNECKDPFLDKERGILCTKTCLNQAEDMIVKIESLFESRRNQISEERKDLHQRTQLCSQLAEVQRQLESIDGELYPILTNKLAITSIPNIINHLTERQDKCQNIFKEYYHKIDSLLKKIETFECCKDFQSQKLNIIESLHEDWKNLKEKESVFKEIVTTLNNLLIHIQQIEDYTEDLEKYGLAEEILGDTSEIDQVMKKLEASKITISELIKYITKESQILLEKINSAEPRGVSYVDREKISGIIESLRRKFLSTWEAERSKLEQRRQLSQFHQDLKSINEQIEELGTQLRAMRGSLGDSLGSARSTSVAFRQFEKTIELLEQKIRIFFTNASRTASDPRLDTSSLQKSLNDLNSRWTSLNEDVNENRRLINLSVQLYEIVEESGNWIQKCSSSLNNVKQKLNSPIDLNERARIHQELKDLMNEAELERERWKSIIEMAGKLYGEALPQHLSETLRRNEAVVESISIYEEQSMEISRKIMTQSDASQTDPEFRTEQIEEAVQVDSSSFVRVGEAIQSFESSARAGRTKLEGVQTSPSHEHNEPNEYKPRCPTFVQPLVDGEVTEGSCFMFECKVDAHPRPRIHWFKDGMRIDSNPDYRASYLDGICRLTIDETLPDDSSIFTCQAVNKLGTASTVGKLTVKEAHNQLELDPPHFIQEIQPVSVKLGHQARFQCQISGNPQPEVSWFKDETPVELLTGFSIENDEMVLIYQPKSLEDSGVITVRASNKVGKVASSAKLNVLPDESCEPPKFSKELSKCLKIETGKPLVLECAVSGSPGSQVYWKRDNQLIRESSCISIKHNEQNGRSILSINEAYPKDSGLYTALARNMAGEAVTSCKVIVRSRRPSELMSDSDLTSDTEVLPPKVIQSLKDHQMTEGEAVKLEAIIVAQPKPEVTWYHNGRPICTSENLKTLMEGDRYLLIISKAQVSDSGSYMCKAVNKAGQASSQCQLEVKDRPEALASRPPVFTQNLIDVSLEEGSALFLSCAVSGHPTPKVTWYRDGQEVYCSRGQEISEDIESKTYSLIIQEATQAHEGNYSVRAVNSSGQAESHCRVTITPHSNVPRHPQFIKYLEDQVAREHQDIQLSCQISGNPEPTIFWYFNHRQIEPSDLSRFQVHKDGHNYSLLIADMTADLQGNYCVVAQNDLGKAVSSCNVIMTDLKKAASTQSLIRLTSGLPFLTNRASSEIRTTFREMTKTSKTTQSYLVSDGSFLAAGAGSNSGGDQFSPSSSKPIFRKSEQITREEHQFRKIGDAEPEISHQFEQESSMTSDQGHPVSQSSQAVAVRETTSNEECPPKIVRHLTNQIANPGDEVTFEAEILGKPSPNIIWYRKGVLIKESPEYLVSVVNNVHKLIIKEAYPEDSGLVTIKAYNTHGATESSANLLIQQSRRESIASSTSTSRYVNEGASVRQKKDFFQRIAMEQAASTSSQYDFKNRCMSLDRKLMSEGPGRLFKSFGYHQSDLKHTDSIESLPCGYKYSISSAKSDISEPASFYSAQEDSFEFKPIWTPKGCNTWKHQQKWRPVRAPGQRDSPFTKAMSMPRGDICPSLLSTTLSVGSLSQTSLHSSRSTSHLAQDIMPDQTSSESNNPVRAPIFMNGLKDKSIPEGGYISLECEVDGYPPPTIRWYHNDIEVASAPGSHIDSLTGGVCRLIIEKCNKQAAGKYVCRASNTAGTISTSCHLKVIRSVKPC